MADAKKYLDFAGLQKYDEQIKKWLGTSIGNAVTDISVSDDASHDGAFIQKVTQANGVVAPTYVNFVSDISANKESVVAPTAAAVKAYVDAVAIAAAEGVSLDGSAAIVVEDNVIDLKVKAGEKVITNTADGLATTLGLAWDATGKKLQLTGVTKDGETTPEVVAELDASHFVLDGMLDTVAFSEIEGEEDNLIFTWNTAAGKSATTIDLGKYLNTEALGDINSSIARLNISVSKLETSVGVYGDASTAETVFGHAKKDREELEAMISAVEGKVDAFEPIANASILALFGVAE